MDVRVHCTSGDRRRSNKNATGNGGHYAWRDRYPAREVAPASSSVTTTASKDVIADVLCDVSSARTDPALLTCS